MDDPTKDPGLRASQDDALVALFVEHGFAKNVRYDHLREQWYYYDTRWRPDKTKHVYDLVRLEANWLWNDTSESDGDKRKMLQPIFNYSKKTSFLSTLATRPGVAMKGDEWDQDPYLLGFENGIMDLRTGEFDPSPPPSLLVSKSVGCDWDPDAAHDIFDAFMLSIFPRDPEVLYYINALLGYSCLGLTREQKFWMWVGRGSNGKGVLARTMIHVLGDYAKNPADTMYMRTKVGAAPSSAARPDLLDLYGARFTYMSEPPGKQFNEEMLKAHTGEDIITARALYSNNEAQFTPTHKIIILTNDPPKTDDVGISMQRRARVVKFDEDFQGLPDLAVGDERIPSRTLEDRVKAQKQGILVELVGFAQFWLENGLIDPARVTEWSREYISENDPLAGWLDANCEQGTPKDRTGSAVLYGDYIDWCARNVIEAKSQIGFTSALGRQFRKERTRTGSSFVGIILKTIEQRVGDDDE